MILFFDTETTGLPAKKKPLDDPAQPGLVQFAARLMDDTATNTYAQFSTVVHPRGKQIHPKAAEVHGISQTDAEVLGMSLSTVLDVFDYLTRGNPKLVAHNLAFDLQIMKIQFATVESTSSYLDACPQQDTMMAAAPILKLPKKWKSKDPNDLYKWPRLEECYKYFFNEELVGAHDAMTDVDATIRVWRELNKLGAFDGGPKGAE